MCAAPFITLENIAVRLYDRRYLENSSWRIKTGRHWAVLGPNGSGKTTLALAILGKVPVIAGRIVYHFLNDDPAGTRLIGGSIGYVSPDQHREILLKEALLDESRHFSGNINEVTTVGDILKEGLLDRQDASQFKARLSAIAVETGILDLVPRNIRAISKGEMSKMLIARALLNQPRLLILDEPFDGLDKQSRKSMTRLIERLMQGSMQVILITHRLQEIVEGFSHVLYLEKGRIAGTCRRAEALRPDVIKKIYGIKGNGINAGNTRSNIAGSRQARKIIQLSRQAGKNKIQTLVEMRAVTIRYKNRLSLDKFNWTMRSAENWALIGPDGSGKTTVLKLITGENLQVYANEIYLFDRKRGSGESIWEIRHHIGIISSEMQARYGHQISAFDMVCSGFFDSNGLYRRCSRQQLEVAGYWIDLMDIGHFAKQKFGMLSHGQKQLVLFARAMVKSPLLLILDDPCEGLDIENRRKVLDIADFVGEHTDTNLIYVNHSETELIPCITHVLNMDAGRVTGQRVCPPGPGRSALMWFNNSGHHAKSNYSKSEVLNERKTKTSKLH